MHLVVINDDIQNNIQASGVGLFSEFLKVRQSAKSFVYLQEVLDAVAMVCVLFLLAILEYGTEPDSRTSKISYIIQPANNPF